MIRRPEREAIGRAGGSTPKALSVCAHTQLKCMKRTIDITRRVWELNAELNQHYLNGERRENAAEQNKEKRPRP